MNRPRFFPCQTPDGRTYVMRSGRPGAEPTIVFEIRNSYDTTHRWRAAQKRAASMNAAWLVERQGRRLRLAVVLAILLAIGIVAAFTLGN